MGVKICPECGGKVSESRNNCPHCGYSFVETKKCPDCEAKVDINVKECPECGYIFEVKEAEKPEEKPKKQKEKHEDKASNVICSSCGSNDLEKLDDYTYKCRSCGSIVKVKKPDVNIYNINSFAGDVKTEDVPVYQVVKDLSEEEFVRNVILYLAKEHRVSALFLSNFRADKSMVSLAYITYLSREYSVDISYSCEIGIDYTVKYFDGEYERTRRETRWEPFSGTGTDGGLTTYCAFGSETQIDSFLPYFYGSGFEYEPFKQVDRYPLKRRPDKSCDESEKRAQVSSLESTCRRNLPGDHNRNFNSNGRCTLGEITAYYYVPAYSLIASSNGHEVSFSCLANKLGRISFTFDDSANLGEKLMPNSYDAKKEFRKTSFRKVSLISCIVLPILMGLTLIFSAIFESLAFCIGLPVYIGVLIAVCIVRKKMINKILDNLVYEFKQGKLAACIKCLESNNLSPLSDEEKEKIM